MGSFRPRPSALGPALARACVCVCVCVAVGPVGGNPCPPRMPCLEGPTLTCRITSHMRNAHSLASAHGQEHRQGEFILSSSGSMLCPVSLQPCSHPKGRRVHATPCRRSRLVRPHGSRTQHRGCKTLISVFLSCLPLIWSYNGNTGMDPRSQRTHCQLAYSLTLFFFFFFFNGPV